MTGSGIIPAWADAFQPPGPGPGPALALAGPVTREWAYGDGRGRGVRVAVVDSGIEAGHPDVGEVEDAVSFEPDPVDDGEVVTVAGPHDDRYGHGTACAGIIRGLVPDAQLVSVRVLGTNLKGSARAFARGLAWCIDHHVQVVNLSMSTASEDWAEVFTDLIDRAAFRRVLVVCAMNNERRRTIPGERSGAFSVACGPGTDREDIWCNPHAPAEWGAAGIDVEVAWLGATRVIASGNSFAAPVVAGHLARIVATHPGITPWQARTVLAELAVNRWRPETSPETTPLGGV